MNKKVPKRLQGPEWYAKKDSLLMTKCRINEKGHIKGTYTDMEGNLYSHWFSNKEAEEFKEQEKIQEEIHFNNIGNYKVGVRANGSLSMYHILDEEEEDMVKAYKEAIHHMGVNFGKEPDEEEIRQRFFETHKKIDQAKGPDCTNISLNIPRMSDLDIGRSIDNVLSSEEYMKQINDFVLEDEKERYVRELLNRLNRIKEIIETEKKILGHAVYDSCLLLIEDVINNGVDKGDKNE